EGDVISDWPSPEKAGEKNGRRRRTFIPVPGGKRPSWLPGCSCPHNASKEKGTAGKRINQQSLHKGASVQSGQHQP
ncbi:hypothetical protein ACVCSR_005531, partial [Escherichia coli]